MLQLTNIGVDELRIIADYFLEYQHDIPKILSDFGDIETDNGYVTLFLKPHSPLLKMAWFHCKENKLTAIGIGRTRVNISLKSLHAAYPNYGEGFVPYDVAYEYAFYSDEKGIYTIKISSKTKLFENGKMIDDIQI